MLSIENLPDPSCPKRLAVKADERASDSLAFQEADPDPVVLEETPTPGFCIRDYVSASRSMGIETSWPFAHRSLKFCLKHDIKDILPPFEPASLVRSNWVEKISEAEQPIACSAAEETIIRNIELLEQRDIDPFNGNSSRLEPCVVLEEPVIHCLDPDSRMSLNNWKSAVEQGTSLDETAHSPPSEIEDTDPSFKPQSSKQFLEKKCRSIAKLGSISEVSRSADDIVSNLSTISDTMASKICPVCKTFSSTSNTTLNAHIDQCLSTESSTEKVMSKFSKIKVKPRKKRLMVDIYVTAQHCTLEDLDRRNGTNWATELKLLAAPNNEAVSDNKDDSKRPKLSVIEVPPPKESSVEAKDEETDEPVYVDSNGIKLRILSKVNDTSLASDELKLRKQERGSMVSKNIFVVKRKHSATKYLRTLKAKTRKGKLFSFKPLKSQIQVTPQGDFDSENEKSEKSLSPISDEHNQVDNGNFSVLSKWVCSKRSDILQKITNKDARFTMTNKVPASASLPARKSLLGPNNSSLKQRLHKKFSRSSSGLLKTKRVEFLCNSVNTVADEKRNSVESSIPSSRWGGESSTSPNSLMLKLSRSSRNLRSSSKGKLESNMDILCTSDCTSDISKRPLGSSISSMKDPTCVALNKNEANTVQYSDLELRQIKESGRAPDSKKFRKHRSNLRSARRGTTVHASLEGGVLGFTKDVHLDVLKKGKALDSNESTQIKSVTNTRINTGAIMDQVSPSRRAECSETRKEQKHHKRHRGSESQEQMIDAMNMPAEFSSGNYSADCSDERAAHNDIVNCAATLKNSDKSYETVQAAYLCRDVNTICRNASEAHIEQCKQALDNKMHIIEDMSSGAIGDIDTRMLDEVEVRGTKDCFIEQMGCHADRASPQESDGCLTNHGDLEIQMPHNTCSVTSTRATSNDKTLASDRELSASPISSASVFSLHSPKGTESKNSNPEKMAKLTNAQYKLPILGSFEERNGTTGYEDSETRNHQVRENLLEIEPKQALDHKPFCCSCRESLSNTSHSSRHDATTMPSKGQQVPSLLLVPRVSSSFSAYQNRMVNTSLELPPQTGCTMNLHDTAMKYPICADLGSPSPSSQNNTLSTSSPVLRLMGKNLMVMHNEELMQPQMNSSEYSHANVLSPGFASTSNLFPQESISYHQHQQYYHPYHHFNHHRQQQIFSGSPASSAEATKFGSHQASLGLPVPPMDGFVRSPFHNYWATQTDQYTHQTRPSKRPESSNAPYSVNEVILIGDSPDKGSKLKGFSVNPMSSLPHTTSGLGSLPPRPLPHYSLPIQLPEVTGSQRAFFQNFYPGSHASFVNQSSYSAGQGPILPNQFIFQSSSAGQVRPTMYYSNTLR